MKKWNRSFLFGGIALFCCVSSHAQSTDREGVLEAVNLLIQSINTDNLELMARVTREDGMNFILVEESDGSYTTKSRAQSEYLDPGEKSTQKFEERIWNPKVLLDGPVAVVWADYDFHVDDKFSHCGVDVFNLIKDEGVWKVANMTWTVQYTDCAPSPFTQAEVLTAD